MTASYFFKVLFEMAVSIENVYTEVKIFFAPDVFPFLLNGRPYPRLPFQYKLCEIHGNSRASLHSGCEKNSPE